MRSQQLRDGTQDCPGWKTYRVDGTNPMIVRSTRQTPLRGTSGDSCAAQVMLLCTRRHHQVLARRAVRAMRREAAIAADMHGFDFASDTQVEDAERQKRRPWRQNAWPEVGSTAAPRPS